MLRAGFGLLSLLICAAIIFYISFGGPHGGEVGATLQAGKNAREQADQISGRTEEDVPISETIKLDEVDDSGGQFRRLKVVSIVPGTPMETVYGLKPGDEITRLGDWGVSDNKDFDLAKSMITTAYSSNWPLVILRNGTEITLTPNSALTHFHPGLFGKPGAVANPTPSIVPNGITVPGQ